MRVRGDELSGALIPVFLIDDLINWVIVTIFILIEYMSMSVTECSSLNVLS